MFRERSGVLTSVDFPAPYPKSSKCLYLIEVEAGFRLQLHFDPSFDVEDHPDVSCPYDYIKVEVPPPPPPPPPPRTHTHTNDCDLS